MDPSHFTSRTRRRAMDGTTFRFEKRGEAIFINDLAASIQMQKEGVVALVTEHKTVQVTGADYWEMIYGDLTPTPLLAGMILASLHERIAKREELYAGLLRLRQDQQREGSHLPSSE
jgi:hypothetical protein